MKKLMGLCKEQKNKIVIGIITVVIPSVLAFGGNFFSNRLENLNTKINTKIDAKVRNIEMKIDLEKNNTKLYVDAKHDKVMTILSDHTKILDRLDKRIYDMHLDSKKK